MKAKIHLKYKRAISIILIIVLCLFIPNATIAQDGAKETDSVPEKITPSLKLSVVKNNDGTRTLEAALSYRDKETKEFVKVKDVTILFYTGKDSTVKLGSIKTDNNGKAQFIIPIDYKYNKDTEGKIHFEVAFEGSEKLEATISETDIIDVQLKLFLEVVDSIRTVRVQAEKILNDGKTETLNEETIQILVSRMFSQLKIGEITLTDGEGTFEFPANIPGDTAGMLAIIAKVEEHELYANVSKSENIDWGIPTSHFMAYHPRSLWTQVAPVWMIVTLTIMLLGVWGHYVYVIIKLFRLKKIKQEIPEIVEETGDEKESDSKQDQ